MNILDLLSVGRVNLSLKATSKDEAIKEIAKLFEQTNVVSDYNGFVSAVMEREALSSTALGDGIVIPHARTKYVKQLSLALAISQNGIDCNSLDGKKSNIFFMIGAPEGAGNAHIEVLSSLSKLLLDEAFKNKLEKVTSAKEALELIKKTELEKMAQEETNSTSNVFIVAVTACPTGIAHTYMAEEALKKAAKEMGVKIKVETNGTDGRKNALTAAEIKEAKGVILAVDRNVDTDRFNGKQLIKVGAKEGINSAKSLIQKVLDGNLPQFVASNSSNKEEAQKTEKEGLYKHLMSGVSYMLPLVISGGILIALAFLADTLTGNGNVGGGYGSTSAMAKALMSIGGAAFGLFVPILGGFIAYSIGDRAALTSGLVAGAMASSGGSGFLGAMAGGFLAGYVIKFLQKSFSNLPKSLHGIRSILFYPVLSVLITGLTMMFVLNPVVSILNNAMTGFLASMSGSSMVLLGLILGGMMAVDMGGPINKAAYVFGVGTLEASLATGGSAAMAAVMAGGMVPPIAIAIATTLFKNKFTKEEKEAGLSNYVMGFSFITEGAIPYAAADPTRVIPANIIGSAIAGALTMLFNIKIPAPHGGILVMFLSNNFIMYLVAIVVGSIVAAIILGLLKKEVKE